MSRAGVPRTRLRPGRRGRFRPGDRRRRRGAPPRPGRRRGAPRPRPGPLREVRLPRERRRPWTRPCVWRPGDAESSAARGRARILHGDYGRRLADFTEAVRLDPRGRTGLRPPGAGTPLPRPARAGAGGLRPGRGAGATGRSAVHRAGPRSHGRGPPRPRPGRPRPGAGMRRPQLARSSTSRPLSLAHVPPGPARGDFEGSPGSHAVRPTELVARASPPPWTARTKARADLQTAATSAPTDPARPLRPGRPAPRRTQDERGHGRVHCDRGPGREYATEALECRAILRLGVNQTAQAVADCTRALERPRHREELYAVRSVANARNGDATAARGRLGQGPPDRSPESPPPPRRNLRGPERRRLGVQRPG